VLAGQRHQLDDKFGVAPELEVSIDAELEGSEPVLLELADHLLRKALPVETGQRRAAPELKRRGQLSRRHSGIARLKVSSPSLDQNLETQQIEGINANAEPVACRRRLDRRRRTEQLAQPRDVRL
jgi:hypothetical protein